MRIPYICPISFLDHTAPICWQGKYVYSSRTMNGEQLSQHVTVERKNKLNKMEIRDGGVRTCIIAFVRKTLWLWRNPHLRSHTSAICQKRGVQDVYSLNLYLHPLLCDSLRQLVRVSLPQASVRERLVTDYESAQNHTEKVIPTHTHPSWIRQWCANNSPRLSPRMRR